ncbi:MAG: phosphatidylglycerophosphatase A [Planctomycetota bacterium]
MKSLSELIGTGFYVGRIKVCPGTFGSLVALPLILPCGGKWLVILTASVIIYFVGVFIANQFIKIKNVSDPQEVVIDEILGYFISYLFVIPTLKSLFIGFLIFRIFDLIKPFPINLCEKLPRGHGVMLDDVMAGLINSFILYLVF